MDVFEAVRTALAVRSYRDEPVPEDVIRRVVEAARLTGSSMNAQPWHFVVVQERETLRRLGELGQHGPYAAQAAFAVVVAIEKESRYGVSDASRAVQSMVLTAWEAGVGSNWAGWYGLEEVAKLLGIPETYHVLVVVPFGYPAEARTGERKNRKSLAEVVSRERFGQPFE